MKKVTSTELGRTPGATIDLALVTGTIAITRHGRLVALLSSEPVDGIEYINVTSSQLLKELGTILDETENDRTAYVITRQGREAAWLLSRGMLQKLHLEL